MYISKGWVSRGWTRLFSLVSASRTTSKRSNRCPGSSTQICQRTSSLCSDWTLNRLPREDVEPSGHSPMPCVLGWACSSREMGSDDPLWSLLNWSVLWLLCVRLLCLTWLCQCAQGLGSTVLSRIWLGSMCPWFAHSSVAEVWDDYHVKAVGWLRNLHWEEMV